eukprot:7799521-Prorocentrum_lima.AAC.1
MVRHITKESCVELLDELHGLAKHDVIAKPAATCNDFGDVAKTQQTLPKGLGKNCPIAKQQTLPHARGKNCTIGEKQKQLPCKAADTSLCNTKFVDGNTTACDIQEKQPFTDEFVENSSVVPFNTYLPAVDVVSLLHPFPA